MSRTYTKFTADKLRDELKSISAKSARTALLKRGYISSTFAMPEYYTPAAFDLINLEDIDWVTKGKGPALTDTLDVYTPKDGLSWRSFNFIHPYVYVHIVRELTEPKNWSVIRRLLTADSLVNCYSLPVLSLKEKETLAARDFNNWLQMAEKDLVKDCAEYSTLVVSDIKNFYPTIYTHAISWAIHGKTASKKDRSTALLGNRLDKLFQACRDGQTNGIPVGSMVSNIVAELILAEIDQQLTVAIRKERGLANRVIIMRYRDDYRILAKSPESGKRVLSLLNKILHSTYNLHLNSDKTHTFDDIVEGTFRPWILEIKDSHLLRRINYNDFEGFDSNHLKDCIIEIYRIQKKYPGGRASIGVLSKLAEALFKDEINLKISLDEILVIVSLLRKLTLLREEATPQVYLILDALLRRVKLAIDKRKVLSAIKKAVSGKADNEYQLLWFHRLCLSSLPKMCNQLLEENDQPLLRVLDTTYIPRDIEIFGMPRVSGVDQRALRHFKLIDRAKLANTPGNPINPDAINIF